MLINKDIYDKVSKITLTDYTSLETINGESYVYVDDFSTNCMIENLLIEIDEIQEKYDDLYQDLQDNYILRPKSDYTGDSYDDRF